MSQKVAIADALNAIEKNLKVFIEAFGIRISSLGVTIDTLSGTASVHHEKDYTSGLMRITVNMPAKPLQTFLSTEEMDRWTGYFVHELCHVFYTDEQAWKDAVKERLHVLVNALEDVRIEAKLNAGKAIGNSRAVLNSLLAWVVAEIPAKTYDVNKLSELPWTLAMRGRVEVCGYDIPRANDFLADMSPEMHALTDWVLPEVALAANTRDILNIARKLNAKAKRAFQNDGDKQGKGKGKGQGQGQQGQGQQQEGPEGQQPPQGQQEGQGAGNGAGNGGQQQPDYKPVDLTPMRETEKQQTRRDLNHGKLAIDAAIIDGIRQANKTAGHKVSDYRAANVGEYSAQLKRDAMPCGTLRQQVARVLKANETETWSRGKSAGRIDRFALNRIGAGITEGVYCKRTISGGYETEIAILIDGSGSMAGKSAWNAAVLALVVAQAAQQVGVKSEILRFPAYTSIKAHNETVTATPVMDRLTTAAIQTNGSTPLTSCMVRTATRLAKRAPGKRKILFVISDGGCDQGPQAVKKACEYAEMIEVDTVALCINMPVHDGFKHGVSCDNSNIAKAGLGKLVAILSPE